MPADRETRAHTAGKWLLAFVVPASAIAIGSLHTTTLIVISLLAAVSCALLWINPPRRTSRASKWVLVAFAILMGATILQSIPLPASFVAAIAPTNADVWARALTPLREAGPSWHPITVAPPATHVEILRGALYGCVFLAALRLVFAEGGTTFLQRVIIGSASLVALVSLAHAAVAAGRVFGFYVPHDHLGFEAGRLGPLLNQNHLAAYLNVGAAVAMHATLSRRERETLPLPLGLGAVLLLAGTSVWAGSRGGTGSLVLAALLVLALRLLKTRGRRSAEGLVVMSALVAAAVLFGVGASEVARADLSGRDLSKLALAQSALRLVPSAPIFGMGRGSFETVYPALYEGTTYVSFRAVENVVVHSIVEWGVPVVIAAVVMVAIAFRPKVVFGAANPPIGVWVAVVVTVLHDLVDFHLEVPAVVVLVAVCGAIVAGARPERRDRQSGVPRAGRLRGVALAVPMAVCGSLVVVLPDVGHSLLEDRDQLARDTLDARLDTGGFLGAARSMMTRYPAEPYFPLAGAIRAQRTRDDSVVLWIARALERYPAFGRAHLVLARSLGRRYPAQARLEYRLAYQWDTQLRDSVITEAKGLVHDYHSALDVVPDTVSSPDLLESLSVALIERLPATSLRLDAEISKRDPDAKGPLRRRIDAATSDLNNEHPWCEDKVACMAPAIDAARALIEREPNTCPPHVLLAKLRVAAGETDEALDELAHAADAASDRAACLRALVQLSLDTGDKRRADRALDVALRSGCGARHECSQLYAWAAATVEARGNHVRAIALYKRAAEVDPDAEGYLQQAGDLADRLGLFADAVQSYERLAARHPEDARWRKRAEEIRAKANQRKFDPPR